MLAALLENNNNARVQPHLPTVKIDRGGGGPSWSRYEIVDIIAATAAFPEISGEDSVARAVRRHKWIGDALPFIREAREKQAAAAFMVGATLADAAAEERHAVQDRLKVEQIIEIIDDVRRPMIPAVAPRRELAAHARGRRAAAGGNGLGLFIGGLVVGGLLVGIAVSKRTQRRHDRLV